MTEKISGIYRIINTTNGKQYIGSSKNVKQRWMTHKAYLRGSYHHSPILQAAWNKYGEAAFTFELLWRVEDVVEERTREEQLALNLLASEYNVCKVANSVIGRRPNAETRAKLSAIRTGKKYPGKVIPKLYKAVVGIEISTGKETAFVSIKHAAAVTGARANLISECARGNREQSGGWVWRFEGGAPPTKLPTEHVITKAVVGTNLATGEEHYFSAICETKALGFHHGHVGACCRGELRTHRGYSWRYA